MSGERTGTCWAAGIGLALLVTPAPAATWKQDYWNPQPAAGDVVLPLPCDGALVFRRVETPVEKNWLADEAIVLGNDRVDGQEHSEAIRRDNLVGSLGTDPGRRFYLLAKYELTRDQYDAVMAGRCPVPSDDGSVPVQNVSWFDAVEFTRRYTVWIGANAARQLEESAGPGAFIRLPSEVEWEFAARGGIAVDAAAYRQRMFPIDTTLEDYVWFAGFKGCDGAAQPIGLKQPNPLGLHDMVGNVQELVLNYYQLRIEERGHGQLGGAVARGGSCLTSELRVRISDRDEVPLYDARSGAPAGRPYTGFRPAVGTTILNASARIEAIRKDWAGAAALRTPLDPQADPIAAIGTIADAQTRPDFRDALAAAAEQFRTEMATRNAIEARSARLLIFSGALSIRDFALETIDLRRARGVLAALGPAERANPEIAAQEARARDTVARAEERRAITLDFLMMAVLHAADDVDANALDEAKRVLDAENHARLGRLSQITRQSNSDFVAMFVAFAKWQQAHPDAAENYYETKIIDYVDRLEKARKK